MSDFNAISMYVFSRRVVILVGIVRVRCGRIVVNCDPSLPSSLGCQTCKWSLSQSSQSSPSSQDRYSCTITQLATHTNHTTQATQLNLHEPTYMVCPLLGFHTSFFTVENREVCSRNEMFHSSNFWQNLGNI